MASLDSLAGPRHYTLRNVQRATWALWIFGVLSVALFGGILARLALQWMGALTVSHAYNEAREAHVALERDLKDAQTRALDSGAAPVETIPAVAAELERSARRLGVTLLSFAPDEKEAELPEDQSPGDSFTATGQKVTVRARGPYSALLEWVRSVAAGDLPVKLDNITLAPVKASRSVTALAVDMDLSFYRVRKK